MAPFIGVFDEILLLQAHCLLSIETAVTDIADEIAVKSN